MAKLIGGPFGLISGKLGNRIYYIVDGEQRSRAVGKVTKPPTEKQLANRLRMKTAFAFAKTVGPFLEMGFGPEAEERNIQPRNAAVGCIRTQALKGVYPDFEIDYTKLLLSRGSLPGLTELSVSLIDPSLSVQVPWLSDASAGSGIALQYRWTVGLEDLDWPRCNDQVMLMAYCPEVEEPDARACFKLSSARRRAGEDVLLLPEAFAGRSVEAYISVITDDRKAVADSQYLAKFDL